VQISSYEIVLYTDGILELSVVQLASVLGCIFDENTCV